MAARYKISDKNIYGFRTGMYRMFLLLPVYLALVLGIEFGLGSLLYRGYEKTAVLEEGETGNVAGEEIPVAQSIGDMERLGTFTLLVKCVAVNHDKFRSGDQVYHWITLDSGEKVIAHINRKAIGETGEAGLYRMPVGVWRQWDPPQEALVYERTLTVTDHYVDMYGDFVPVLTQEDYGWALGRKASVWVFVIGVAAYRIIGVRRWRFAPALLWKRDPLLPRNDLECFSASTFAIWAHSFPMLEGWPLVTGAHGSRKVVANFKNVALGEQWGIHDRQEGLRTVHELVEEHAGKLDTVYAGWDLCRANQLVGMMYLVKMITREEMDQEFARTGKVIQQRFSSWEEMAESYLEGYEAWRRRCGDPDAAGSAARRRYIFRQLKENPDGPYAVPFGTDLTGMTYGGGKAARDVVKRVLRNYRGPCQ